MKEYGSEWAEHWFFTPSLLEQVGAWNMIRAGQNIAKPHYHVGPRFITYYSIHFVLRGSGVFIDEGEKQIIQAGDIFCLYANHTHSYYTDAEHPLEMVWIALDGEQVLELLSFIGITEEKTKVTGVVTKRVRSIWKKMILLFQTYKEKDQLKKYSLLYELFHHLHGEMNNTVKEQVSKERDWLQQGKEFIDLYACEGIAVHDVATYVGINRTHFSNVYTQQMGISPAQYIQQKVMEKAVQFLTDPTNTVTEIALSLCYSDVYSFSRSFKNYYGMSPTAYRESIIACYGLHN